MTKALKYIDAARGYAILGPQSHVKVSFEVPEYTANSDALGTLRILEAIRILKMEKKIKFYQASSSELNGKVQEIPQNELTPFYPRSPYAVAKLYAFWVVKNYREAYGIFACNGTLFNHESTVRRETFVTRKITRAAVKIYLGFQEKLYLGNLNAQRNWGHAKDYVYGMWRMLQYEKPEDFVLATGKTYSIRDFCNMAFKELGIKILWKGSGHKEVGINMLNWREIISVDVNYYRPTELDILVGDAIKAKSKLGRNPKYDLNALVKEMIRSELNELTKTT